MTRFAKAVLAMFVFSLTIGVAMAQVRTSAITGTVTDQSGAVVPNAAVTVTNQRTNVASVTKTNASGVYTVPYLPFGTYTVSVKASGFQTYTSSGISLATGATVQASVQLTVGKTTQVVQVKASAAQLQTQSSNVVGGVGSHVIDTVPNINNNPLYYAGLAAGVIPGPSMYNYEKLGVGYSDRQAMSAIRINGGQVGDNDITLDGVPTQGGAWHVMAVIPNSDALQEVRVQTNNLPANLGGGQGIIQMVTKSGTNHYHGDAYYIMRNEALNASGLYNDTQNFAKGRFRVQEGGGSIGGPIIIPKVFNGRDKVFGFFAFDRLTFAQNANGILTVPTLAQRQGDFTGTMFNNGGTPTQINFWNPWSAYNIGGTNYERHPFYDSAGNPVGVNYGPVTTQYPYGSLYDGNLADVNCAKSASMGSPCGGSWNSALGNAATDTAYSPYSLLYYNGYPVPNITASDAYGDNNYAYAGTVPQWRNNLNTRLDVHLGRNSFYASGGMQRAVLTDINVWANPVPSVPTPGAALGFGQVANNGNATDFNPYVAVGDVITLNPTTLIDVHVGLQRVATTTAAVPATGQGWTSTMYNSYGVPAEIQSLAAIYGAAPSVGTLTSNGNLGSGTLNRNQWQLKNEHQTNWDMAGSITKIVGKWTLMNGADYRVYLGNWHDLIFATPSLDAWNDTGTYTQQYADQGGNGTSLNTTGLQNSYYTATTALGLTAWRDDPGSTNNPSLAAKYLAFYSQNDWKVNKRLTLNLGVRYSIQPGVTARLNNMSSLNLNALNPYAGTLSGSQSVCTTQNYYSTFVKGVGTGAPALPAGTCFSSVTNPLANYGAFVFPGTYGNSRNLWNTTYGNISPRLGAEFRINNSTVLRGGWGRIYAPSNSGFNANTLIYGGNAFVGGTFAGTSWIYRANNGLPAATFDNIGSTQVFLPINTPGTTTPVQNPSLYGSVLGSSNADTFPTYGYNNGYVDQWNVTLEHRFHGWLLSAGYVGSRGNDLGWRGYPINGVWDVPNSTLQQWRSAWIASSGAFDPANQPVPNPMTALAGQAYGNSGGQTLSLMNASMPYLGLLGEEVYHSVGWSRYNSMQLQASHSYSNGLTAQFNYVWSQVRGIGAASNGGTYAEQQLPGIPLGANNNNGNPNIPPSILGYDVPQRFVGVVTYQLPFGKGTRFASSSPVVNAIAGGWTVGTVVTIQSGQPWGPECSSINGACIPTGEPLTLPKSMQGWTGSNPANITLPDGNSLTPPSFSYLYWNPDAFQQPVVQFPITGTGAPTDQYPNGAPIPPTYAVDQYWNGTTPTYMNSLRMPYFTNTNLTISRTVNLTERVKLRFEGEATNLFNNVNWQPTTLNSNTVTSYTDPTSLPAGAKIGENSSWIGALSMSNGSFFDPRQVTLTMRVLF